MKHFLYSPSPAISYRLQGVPACEVSTILQIAERSDAVWNLFWLSNPALDTVLSSPNTWYKHYRPVEGALAALIRDTYEDEVLFRKLRMHPYQFLDWWEREDHTIYDAYDVLGGPLWVNTVMSRAEEAGSRAVAAAPPVHIVGNVIKVDFPRKVA